jgi:hypothetical protein
VNILAQIFKAVVVATALRTLAFLRKHPWTALFLFLFFFVLPFVWNSYTQLAGIKKMFGIVGNFIRGFDSAGNEISTSAKVLRNALVLVVCIVVPGATLLYLLLQMTGFLSREKARKEIKPAFTEPESAFG